MSATAVPVFQSGAGAAARSEVRHGRSRRRSQDRKVKEIMKGKTVRWKGSANGSQGLGEHCPRTGEINRGLGPAWVRSPVSRRTRPWSDLGLASVNCRRIETKAVPTSPGITQKDKPRPIQGGGERKRVGLEPKGLAQTLCSREAANARRRLAQNLQATPSSRGAAELAEEFSVLRASREPGLRIQ